MPFIPHGKYEWRTCFDVVQHQFVAREVEEARGWCELLEIRGVVPEGALRFAVCFFTDQTGVRFYPFRKMGEAENAFAVAKRVWRPRDLDMIYMLQQPGYQGVVDCGSGMPWFYAWKLEDVEGLLAHPGYEARRSSQG